jgi:hypothetical protein
MKINTITFIITTAAMVGFTLSRNNFIYLAIGFWLNHSIYFIHYGGHEKLTRESFKTAEAYKLYTGLFIALIILALLFIPF